MHAQFEPSQTMAEDATSPATEPGVRPKGQAVFITLGTLFRRPVFLDPEAARAVARVQSDPRIWGRSRCLAWVLMPDRWQGMVLMSEGDSLDPLVRRFKGITANAVDARFRINGWLWGKGYNQRELQREQDLVAVARHLVANPVRAGLARSVGAYPYWDAVWLQVANSPGGSAMALADP